MEVQHIRNVETGDENVVYTYLINRGCSEERHYGTRYTSTYYVNYIYKHTVYFTFIGLKAAEMTALPSTIVHEAKTIASNVSQQLMVWFTLIRLFRP